MKRMLEDALTHIEAAADGVRAHRAFDDVARHIGFDGYLYVNAPNGDTRQPTVDRELSTIDPRFVTGYEDADLMSADPVLLRAAQNSAPFVPIQVLIDLAHPVAAFGVDLGFTAGLTLPIHGRAPSGIRTFAVARLGWKGPVAAMHSLGPDLTRLLQIAVAFAHEKHIGTMRDAGLPPSESGLVLTARERDCLSWSAVGKTSSETAIILGVSEATVNYHFKNAMRKLDVVNRPHAVTRAIALGLISV